MNTPNSNTCACAACTATQANEPRTIRSNTLQCRWISWSVVNDSTLRLNMPAHNCCDMLGAIKTAQALCPEVRHIKTYAGGKKDTEYILLDNKWQAFRQQRKQWLPQP